MNKIPKESQNLCEAAAMMYESGQYDMALRCATLSIDSFRQNAEAYRLAAESCIHIAYYYAQEGDIEKGKTYYRYAINATRKSLIHSQGNPTAPILANAAFVNFVRLDYKQAEEFADKALEVDVRNIKAHFVKGMVLTGDKTADKMEHFRAVAEELTLPRNRQERWILKVSNDFIGNNTPK